MCEICRQNPCVSRYPNHVPPRAAHVCDFCKEGIHAGEEYLVNADGLYRHYDCFYHFDDIVKWLGFVINTMEDDE